MSDFEDEIESGVESQVSPEPNESEESLSANEGGAASVEDQKDLEQQSVPYSRFKEINEQSKEYAAKLAAMEQKLASFQQQRQPAQAPAPKVDKYGKLIDRLQGIDPEFGEYNKDLSSKLERLEKIEADLQARQVEDTRRQAKETLGKLYTENKVSGEDQEIYESMIRTMAADGKVNSMEDLPRAFKEVHDKYSKYIDGIRRSERAKYVTDKAKDASKPTSQPKGPATKGPAQKPLSVDREQAKADLIKAVMAKRRAASDI